MDMAKKFNSLMKGFISEDITLDWLIDNPEGTLCNGSSFCNYKLKLVDGKRLLGAYGVSRFTNWCFFEITESGEIGFEWYLQEMYIVGNPESEKEMYRHNQEGFERIRAFGIKDN